MGGIADEKWILASVYFILFKLNYIYTISNRIPERTQKKWINEKIKAKYYIRIIHLHDTISLDISE